MNHHSSGWAFADLTGDVLEVLFDLADIAPMIAIVIVLCAIAWLVGKAQWGLSAEADR